MSTTLSVICDTFARLQPFAIMAFVPLLLWVWHFETTPDDEPHVLRDAAQKGVSSTDALGADESLEGSAA